MKLQPTSRAGLVLALVLITSAISFARFAAPAAPAASGPADPASEALKTAMHQMDESLKTLGKGITPENRAASLDELGKFQAAVLAAKALTPDSAAKVDEKKRAAFVNEFHETLIETLQISLTAEVAIVEGKYKDADTVIRNKLGGVKSKGHGKFKTDGGQ